MDAFIVHTQTTQDFVKVWCQGPNQKSIGQFSYPRIMFFPLKKALGCHREQSYHAIKGTVKYQSLIR